MALFKTEINGLVAKNSRGETAFFSMFDKVALEQVIADDDLLIDSPNEPEFKRWSKPNHLDAIDKAFGQRYCRKHSRLLSPTCDLCD